MSFKQEKFVYGFTNLYDIFLETKHGQNLSWGDRLATSKFHGPKCCTINKPPTSQQATRRALQSGHSLKTTGTPNSAACSFQAVVGMYWETLERNENRIQPVCSLGSLCCLVLNFYAQKKKAKKRARPVHL